MKKKTNVPMKIALPIIAIILIVTAAFFFLNVNQTKGVVGNKEFQNEIVRLETSLVQGQTPSFDRLKAMAGDDKNAQNFISHAEFFIQNGAPQHANHELNYLYKYSQSGTVSIPCIPDEISHLSFYLQKNDTQLVKDTISGIKENYDAWKNESYSFKQKYPLSYANLNNVIARIDKIMKQIDQNNFNNLTDDIDYVSNSGLCL